MNMRGVHSGFSTYFPVVAVTQDLLLRYAVDVFKKYFPLCGGIM